MSIREDIIAQIQRIGEEMKKQLPPLTDDLLLTHSGLDSLAIAILVTRLEDTLGIDPFLESSGGSYPVTLGDFFRTYEESATSSLANSGLAPRG